MEDEEAFPDCEVCYGESGRERKSEGSAICMVASGSTSVVVLRVATVWTAL